MTPTAPLVTESGSMVEEVLDELQSGILTDLDPSFFQDIFEVEQDCGCVT
jgi:hypothetical protein